MKKFIRIFAIPLSLIIISCFSISCKTTTNTEQYIGTFNTIFVDQQNTDLSVSFTLVVNEDQTFSLLRRDTSAFIKGTWTSATISGTTQLLCYSNDVTYKNSNWHAYFSLSMTDDGKLLATLAPTATFGHSGLHTTQSLVRINELPCSFLKKHCNNYINL